MYVAQLKVLLVTTNLDVNQATASEVKPHHQNPDGINLPDAALALTPLGLIMISAGLFMMLSKVRTATLDKIIFPTNPLHRVPCKNCRYFTNNHYLKCAVQPFLVLTEQAVNCSDYCSKTEKL